MSALNTEQDSGNPAAGKEKRRVRSVEEALCSCAAVGEAVAVEWAGRPAGRKLVAYVTERPGQRLLASALRAELAQLLPPELVPTTYLRLDALPRDARRVIDLAALPSPDDVGLGVRLYEVAAGPVEKALAAMWQELLGVEQVGRNDHFFELGGYSALAVQLVHRLRQETRVDIGVSELFLAPTLERFAAAVSQRISLDRGLAGLAPALA